MGSTEGLIDAVAKEQYELERGATGTALWSSLAPALQDSYRADARRILELIRLYEIGEAEAAIRGYQAILDGIREATGVMELTVDGEDVPADFRPVITIVREMRRELDQVREELRRIVAVIRQDLIEWAEEAVSFAPDPPMTVSTAQVEGVYSAVANRARRALSVTPGT